MTTRQRPGLLAGFLTELVIIVVGVLIALGAQALVQERADRREEHAFLLDLLEEFQANQSQLQSDIEQTRQAVEAANAWRGTTTSSVPIGEYSSVNPYAASLNPARFDPNIGTLRSLIDGGDLGLVRDRQLRAALAGWSDRTQEQVMTSVTVDIMRSMLMQFLIPHGQEAPTQALELDLLLLQVVYDQQRRLSGSLDGIIAMLEQEVGP